MGPLRLLVTMTALLLGATAANAADPAGLVDEISQVSGVQNGLCVILDCGDGVLPAEFARTGRFLVHGIAADAKSASAARQRLADPGLSGIGTIECQPLDRLPYADNLVNLIVADDGPAVLKKGLTFAEVLRVLAPEGQAVLGVAADKKKDVEAQLNRAGAKDFKFVEKSRPWLVLRKPRPEGMDDWTHWNHAPDGALVSRDKLIERPNQIQWIAGQHFGAPRQWVPGAGNPNAVRLSAGTALYIMGSQLLARDAFNGVMLWNKGYKPLDSHSVILSGKEVYLIRDGRPVALEARTGNDVRTYGEAADAKALILSNGLLLAFGAAELKAHDATTGAVKWTSAEAAGAGSPVIDQGRMYFLGKEGLTCLALADGKVAWKKPARPEIMFAFGDKLLTRTNQKVSAKETKGLYTAISGQDGADAWTHESDLAAETYFASGLVWVQHSHDRASVKTEGFHNPQGGIVLRWDGIDPADGKVKRSFVGPVTLEFRCHTLYMTDRFLIGNRPVYFTDWLADKVTRFEATRIACGSVCGLGQGMFYGLYTNSAQCMCMRPAMSGVGAYTSDGKTIDGAVPIEEQGRLETGPAKAPADAAAIEPEDWVMYRHEAGRTSAGAGELPAALALAWERKLLPDQAASAPAEKQILRNDWAINKISGDAMNQPVAVADKVFASLTHAGQVVAMDAKTGKIAWRFLAPARVDGPPAVAKGICIVGCNDGWVYALRADNGEQVWRFRAAPAERRIVAYGQVESRWPVVGGPVVLGDNVYVLAGRTTEADGGLYVYGLEIATGKCLWTACRVKPDDGPIGAWNLRGVKDDYVGPADLLDCDGKTLAISGHRTGRVDIKTGQSTSGGNFSARRFALMVSRYASDNQKVDNPPVAYPPSGTVLVTRDAQKKACVAQASKSGWKVALPAGARVEALAAVGETILAAVSGGNGPGELWVIKDGTKLGSYPLPGGPVIEGLSAARGRVYVALQNGSVACFAAQ